MQNPIHRVGRLREASSFCLWIASFSDAIHVQKPELDRPSSNGYGRTVVGGNGPSGGGGMSRIRGLAALCVALLAIGALPLTAATSAARPTRPASRRGRGAAAFRVGAAVESITPPPFGTVRNDPANCTALAPDPSAYDGLRRFAFEEPYIDQAHTGRYQPGDPYLDCNGNGRWEGTLLGGGADTPRFAGGVADRVTARAIVVSNRHRTLAVEVLDQEGLFGVYQARIRAKVAADGYRLDGIFISATHDESAPDTLGISGVSQTTSGVNAYYVGYLVDQSAKAIERAYRSRQAARIKYAEAIEPRDLRQCFSSYPFVDDQLMPSLQAVDRYGRVIATMGNVSQHAETLGFNPDPTERNLISSDWPHFFRTELEQRYGGVAIEMAGSVGSNETPQVFPAPISRVPERFVDASHPAGCRTLFGATGTPVDVGYHQETTVLGRQLATAVGNALDRDGAWSTTNTLWGQRRPVCITLTNTLFQLGAQLGVFAGPSGFSDNCTVEYPPNATGATKGDELQSHVAAFRIGDGEFASVPGEVFPFTYLRSFLGPEDMPRPQGALPPWVLPHMHTRYRFIDGLAEDMLGYIFPRGNAVGVPGEPGSDSDVDRFGCGHSDDSEAASSATGDIVGSGLVGMLDRVGGAPENIITGRYVLPDGVLSRDPLGQPASIKCNVDTVFVKAKRPAVGVWLPGGRSGRVVIPRAWMSLSGRRQGRPDRNTRGWIDRHGVRHWLDVYPDITGAPARVAPLGP